MKNKFIVLFKGDSSDFPGNQEIVVELETSLDLTGCKAHFKFLDFTQTFDPIPEDKNLTLVFTKDDTAKFPLGAMDAEVWLENAEGKKRTVANRIHIVVTNSVPEAYDNEDPQAITVSVKGVVHWDDIQGKPEIPDGEVSWDDITDKPNLVKSVNGKTPDENGNVVVETEGGGGSSVEVVEPNASAKAGQAADAKATYDALCEANDAAMLAVYYPEGNVTSIDQITTEGLTYTYDDTNHTAMLSNGLGATGDVVIPWKVVKDGVEYTVTAVGNQAFYSTFITSVIAPTSVTFISESAFGYCLALKSVSLPSVTSISESALDSCSSLTSVSLPSVTSIASFALRSCSALKSVSLPSVTIIGPFVFDSCSSLESVSLPSVTGFTEGAFNNSKSLTSVDFGATPRDSVPNLGLVPFGSVPTSCKIIIPLGMYDEWIAADGWKDLYAAGYKFVGYADAADVAEAKSIANAANETANAAIPKYGSVAAAVADGVLTLTPFSRNALTSDGTAFTVLMGGGTGRLRDCVFVVMAGSTAPTISWGEKDGQTFSPRTDSATDMEIAANTTKVFWVTEYAPDCFVVAGWEVTA